jgi:hypothetical protein
MNRVTGIGGIFFKARDAPSLQGGYKQRPDLDQRSGPERTLRGAGEPVER